jgi:hypothetical protein
MQETPSEAGPADVRVPEEPSGLSTGDSPSQAADEHRAEGSRRRGLIAAVMDRLRRR